MKEINSKQPLLTFSYHGEPMRKMTKTQMKKYIEHRNACEEIYKGLLTTHVFDGANSDKEKLDILIDMCCGIQSEICHMADSIKEYAKSAKEYSKTMTPQMFRDAMQFVKNHSPKTRDGKSVDEKKTEDKFKVDVFKHSFKRNLCQTFLSFGKITVPDEKSIEIQIIPSVQTIENKELEKDLKMCAGWREIMDTQFYPEYRLYAMAAEHLSHGDLDYTRFKTIVNYHYYGSLDPKSEFFRNSYSKPLIQFMDAYKLCEKYGYEDFFSEVKNYFYEMFMKEQETESECA